MDETSKLELVELKGLQTCMKWVMIFQLLVDEASKLDLVDLEGPQACVMNFCVVPQWWVDEILRLDQEGPNGLVSFDCLETLQICLRRRHVFHQLYQFHHSSMVNPIYKSQTEINTQVMGFGLNSNVNNK